VGAQDREIARHALEDVGMADYEDRPLGALSGGQQQRVFIARALAQHPQILLLDEPTTGIDTTTQHTVLELIQRLHEELHLTVVLVSHDINLIAPLAERLALLKTRLYAVGTAKEILRKDILAQVYGPQILTTDTGHVIVADHHLIRLAPGARVSALEPVLAVPAGPPGPARLRRRVPVHHPVVADPDQDLHLIQVLTLHPELEFTWSVARVLATLDPHRVRRPPVQAIQAHRVTSLGITRSRRFT